MPEVAGKRVVIFGDSLSAGSGSPGAVMGQLLESVGASVQVNARIGRSANNFWGREDAAQLDDIAAFAPQLVIVELGTNDIGLTMSVDRIQMQKLRDALAQGGAEVWAFGPPAFATGKVLDQQGPANEGAAQVATMMVSVFGNRFIDLRRMTRDMTQAAQGRAPDGVHFTTAGGTLLGKRMADEFIAASSSNLLFWAPAILLLAYAIFR